MVERGSMEGQGEGGHFNIHKTLFACYSESDSETPCIARLGISFGVVYLQRCLVVA